MLLRTNFSQDVIYLDSTATPEERAEDLLTRMTIEEKIGQMIQAERGSANIINDIEAYFLGSILSGGGSAPAANTPAAWADMYDGLQSAALSTRLGIPLIYGTDAVHGHNNAYGAVIFPHNIGLGCTRDSILVENAARITALEVSATGLNWTFAPCIAVARNERWGRTYESFGETPDLARMMAAASVRGFQGDTLAHYSSILACAKHFIADGATTDGKDQGDAQIDEEILRTIHLPGYVSAVENQVGSVMISYSSWNGEKCHGSYYLITTLLKEELGFEGFVVSDWNAIDQLSGLYEDKVATAINAGIDMAMVPYNYINFYNALINLAGTGKVSEERINDAVRRILKIKFRMGLFENAYADRSLQDSIGTDTHRNIAREAVRKSVVLLKKKDNILPLDKDNGHIFVAGEHADNLGYQCGGWTISWQGGSGDITTGTTILEALYQAAPGANITYSENAVLNDTTVDVAIVVIGETPYAEGAGDSNDLILSASRIDLVRNLKNAGVPVIVILISGRPLILEPIIPYTDAVFAAWLPGTEGLGVTDVLFGDYNPSGVLSFTWPENMADLPINFGDAEYNPLFEYGFGITDISDMPAGSAPDFYSAVVHPNGIELSVSFNKKMTGPDNANSEFIIQRNGEHNVSIEHIEVNSLDSTSLILRLSKSVNAADEVTIAFSGQSVYSKDGGQLATFGPEKVYNSLNDQPMAFTIPGKIEAEDYYDMSGVQTEPTADTGGGLNVGYIDDGDWMSYRLNVSESAYYEVVLRVASLAAGGTIHFKKGEEVLGTIYVPVTGGWQNWQNTSSLIFLEAGIYAVQLYAAQGGYNVNWVNFKNILSIHEQQNPRLTYQLEQNFPNPFNPMTEIKFTLPMSGKVTIYIYNTLGQKMETLLDKNMPAGKHNINFDGHEYSSGIYYYKIRTGDFQEVKKMILLK